MQSNPTLVLGLVIVLVSVFGGLLGGLPFMSMKNPRTKHIGVVTMFVGVLIGLSFTFEGAHHQKAIATQRNHLVVISRDAQVVQRLLRGEEVQLTDYSDFGRLVEVSRVELKLPVGITDKFCDPRRYTIRFDTNGIVTATNH